MVFERLLGARPRPSLPAAADCVAKADGTQVDDTDEEGWDFVGVNPQVGSVGGFVIDDYLTTQASSTEHVAVGSALADDAPRISDGSETAKPPAEDACSGHKDVPRTEPSAADDGQSSVPNSGPVLSTPNGPSEVDHVNTSEPATCVPADTSGAESEDEPGFQCFSCGRLIFREGSIASTNYNTATGPAYLVNGCSNVRVATETQTVMYSTGRYKIKEVECERCSANLGVTYSSAFESQYKYKVGKFLVGVDRLRLPLGIVHPQDKCGN